MQNERDPMSYLTYWRLSRSPFSPGHPTVDYFVSGTIGDAMTRVEFLVQHSRRLGLLFGPHGVGKSSFIRYFIGRSSRFPKHLPGLVDMAGTTPDLLARRFRDALWGDPGLDRFVQDASLGRTLHEIDELIVANNAVGRQPILFVDNADEVGEDVFQTLGIILRRPGNWSALLAVDESLLVEIPRRILEECDVRVDLPAWDLGLTAEYIETQVANLGNRDDIFSAQGITRIHELGEGIPKRMFQLAEIALAVGAERRVESIDAELIDLVCEDFSFGILSQGPSFPGFANR
jgi:type II secretory pathway predicted ATPase ExeA